MLWLRSPQRDGLPVDAAGLVLGRWSLKKNSSQGRQSMYDARCTGLGTGRQGTMTAPGVQGGQAGKWASCPFFLACTPNETVKSSRVGA